MTDMDEKGLIKISVRSLVEFILREGDIDNRRHGGADRGAMLEGSRIHRKIQRLMGAGYHAEVTLKRRIPCKNFILQVEGRADGIIEHGQGRAVIDEIKGTLRDIAHIEEPVKVHLAQAKCYACIYARDKNLEQLDVQITYCHMETEEIKRFVQTFSRNELEAWFLVLVEKYEKWAGFQIKWREKRNASVKEAGFPFTYRAGQRDIAVAVYRTMLRKKKLFIQAPTGAGKTMAAIFPAVQAVGEGLGQRIFYLTAKTITRTVAEQAFNTLKSTGLKFKVITLTAKEKICFCEEAICNPDYCPYAKGHFDRVNDAVFDMLVNGDDMSRESIEKQALKYNVCPFEMSLDVSLWTDAVICDYNYAFDPNAHLKRFFSDDSSADCLFLIDEAHNLVDRGRDMYSAVLYKEDIQEMKRLVKEEAPALAKRLGECNKQLLALKKECESYRLLDSVSHIAVKLMNVMTGLEDYLEVCQDEERREKTLGFYFQIRDFLNIHDLLDDNYVIYSEYGRDGRFKLKLFCVNPAANLETYLDKGNSTVFFSATLLPVHYYKKLLSVKTDDYAVYVPSSFPEENRLLLLGTDISTRYTMRGRDMYEKFATYILETVKGRKGNYMIFFPSYRLMADVYDCFLEVLGSRRDIECIVQSKFMGEEAREIFLETFEEDRQCSLAGFCVLGGIFSEGIDLAKDRLIGVVIVGTGLPQVCNDREILKQYFDGENGRGFDYAYLYPGMNKVLQSAGRVIRTEEDKGVIVLLDERFNKRQYVEIFPREWDNYKTCCLENMGGYLENFWNKRHIDGK